MLQFRLSYTGLLHRPSLTHCAGLGWFMYTTWPLLSALSRGGVGTGASEQGEERGRERVERRYMDVYKYKIIDKIEVHTLKNPPCQTQYCLLFTKLLQ